ncbi:MAG TPA: hypothetical protein VN493_23035 [Thermoanaerobaculia bacterium]|nr:hypothetical protein [Thermoanaerobaculia bacterium]
MGQEKSRRIWPLDADRTVTVRVTHEQWVRWYEAASNGSMKPHLGTYLARAADFYAARLKARGEMARRLEKDGRL